MEGFLGIGAVDPHLTFAAGGFERGFFCFLQVAGANEEILDTDIEGFSDSQDHGGADPAVTCFILLDLLLADAQLVGQLVQRHVHVFAVAADIASDLLVDLCR